MILKDFDSHDTVFYLDPPYVPGTTYSGEYLHKMDKTDHINLCNQIFNLKGYVALSGYKNDIYDGYPWDDIKTWRVHVSAQGHVFNEENNRKETQDIEKTKYADEWLYIKDFSR